MSREQYNIKVYSEEEINLYLEGERRHVDRLLLEGLNSITKVLIVHANKEEEVLEELGTPEQIKLRRLWIDARIKRQENIDKLINRVVEGAALWAVLGALGIVFIAIGNYVVDVVKGKVG